MLACGGSRLSHVVVEMKILFLLLLRRARGHFA